MSTWLPSLLEGARLRPTRLLRQRIPQTHAGISDAGQPETCPGFTAIPYEVVREIKKGDIYKASNIVPGMYYISINVISQHLPG